MIIINWWVIGITIFIALVIAVIIYFYGPAMDTRK